MAENADSQEVFRGHLEECLKHFCEKFEILLPKGRHGSTVAKLPIAGFCDAAVITVGRWIAEKSGKLPIGDKLIRLMCYLDMHEYRVIELEILPKAQRKFIELIGFGIFSGEEAAKLLGYACSSSLYAVMKGSEGMSPAKEEKMFALWKEKREELERVKKEKRERYLMKLPGAKPVTTNQMQVALSLPVLTATHSCGYKVARSLMESLSVLFEDGCLEKLSSEELADLQKTSGKTVLQLVSHLSELNSRLFSNQLKGVN